MISSFKIGLQTDNIKISRIDLGGDGQDEIVVTGGFGEKPMVEIYRMDGSLVNSFLAYDEKFSGGLSLTVSDLDSDNKEEIVIVPEFLGGSHLRIFDGYGQEKMTNGNFLVEADFFGGFEIAVVNFGQNKKEILSLVQNLPTGREDIYKYIEIDVSEQTFKCFENGFLVCDLITSTGKPSTPTKIGVFDAFAKYEMAYGGADGQRWGMPYFISFYKVGNIENGIHELPFLNGRREGEGSLGRAVSHGCVRLAIGDAKKVYDWLEVNKTKVIVNP